MRLVNLLILSLSFLTRSVHLSTEAGVPASMLVTEIQDFQTLAVNENTSCGVNLAANAFYSIAEKSSAPLR